MDNGENYGSTGTGGDNTLAETTVRWLTIEEAEAGMVLARPLFATQQGRLALTLAAGTILSADTLLQLIAHSVECVGVQEHVVESTEMKALRRSIHQQRLEEIFGAPVDQIDADRRPLFDLLLSVGSWQ